jgi:hypothetical protein
MNDFMTQRLNGSEFYQISKNTFPPQGSIALPDGFGGVIRVLTNSTDCTRLLCNSALKARLALEPIE